jgi:hypothetical protein
MFTPFSFIQTISAGGGGGDANATAYLAAVVAAGGSINDTITSATNTLFVDLKAAGIYNKLVTMYPFIGGTAASNAFNALNPISGSAYYYLEFVGSWTHNASGSQGNGTNTGANTWMINSTSFPTFGDSGGNRHMCVYTNGDGGTQIYGYDWGGGTGFQNFLAVNYGLTTQYSGFGSYTTSTNISNIGFYVAQITASVQSNFKNGTSQGSNAGRSDQAMPNNYMSIGADNRSTAPSFSVTEITDKRYAFAAAGAALSDAENSTYSSIITAFNTTLGRQG